MKKADAGIALIFGQCSKAMAGLTAGISCLTVRAHQQGAKALEEARGPAAN